MWGRESRTSTIRAAVLAASLAVLCGGTPPAHGQPNTCPAPGPDTVAVTVTEPLGGAAVAGRVSVRGTASSPVEVARVELFVGDARKDFAVFDPPAREGTFLLMWDAAGAATGPATVRVVACGGGQGTVPVVRGVASVAVDVGPSPPRPAPLPLTPVADDAESTGGGALWVGGAFAVAGLAGLLVASGYRLPGPSRLPRPRRRAAPPAAPRAAPSASRPTAWKTAPSPGPEAEPAP